VERRGILQMIKVVCFDLDGTLIINTNSVAYLCTLNGRQKELEDIELMERREQISWIEADFLKAALLEGLAAGKIAECFDAEITLLNGIGAVVNSIKEKGIMALLITAGPVEVAEVVGRRFGFDRVYGSIYGVRDNIFTGELLEHLDDAGKLRCLEDFCSGHKIRLHQCAAVGDSLSDVLIFGKVGLAIALNYDPGLAGLAHQYIKTDDLRSILRFF
jgi:phosphoserine phosphatase